MTSGDLRNEDALKSVPIIDHMNARRRTSPLANRPSLLREASRYLAASHGTFLPRRLCLAESSLRVLSFT